MDIYKIVKGNSFVLHIQMQKAYISKNKQMLEDIDVSDIDNLEVLLTDIFGDEVAKMKIINIDKSLEAKHNEISVSFPNCNLDEGIYGVTVKGKYNGKDICSIEMKLFRIVGRNGKSHIPLGIVEGEMGGMYNTKYWIELNTEEDADIDNTSVCLETTPSVIAYDGNEHKIILSWSIKNKDKDIIPSSLQLIAGDNITELDVNTNNIEVTRTEVGVYEFHILATINGSIYKATARTRIGSSLYGVSSASNASDLDLSYLNGSNESLVEKELTVKTTEQNDTVWFVSLVPLRFIQANIEADFHETIVGSLYYYNSDPLIAGDNTYTIKAK